MGPRIAPNANIVLFEANSNGSDLYTAVNTARKYSNGSIVTSVVSMSWGGSENYFVEFAYDGYFKTYSSSHTGVTFVASTGDDGAPGIYPALSANVLAIGGTTLDIKDSSGTYNTESGWTGSGGGVSGYISRPSYQNAVQTNSYREIPDVSFDADPSSASWSTIHGMGGAGGVVERRRHQSFRPLLGRHDRHRQSIPRKCGFGNAQSLREFDPSSDASLRFCRIDDQLQSVRVLSRRYHRTVRLPDYTLLGGLRPMHGIGTPRCQSALARPGVQRNARHAGPCGRLRQRLSNTDNITNRNNHDTNSELQFTVSNTTSGATVTIYSDGTAIGSATASGTTTTITTSGSPTLADGAT